MKYIRFACSGSIIPGFSQSVEDVKRMMLKK